MPALFGECLCLFARMLRRQFNERGRAPALPGIDSVRTATRCRAGSARMAGSISSARQAESYRGACGGFQPGGLTFRAISANSCARLRCCFAASASSSATAAHSSTESSPRSQRSTSCNSACSIRSERLFAKVLCARGSVSVSRRGSGPYGNVTALDQRSASRPHPPRGRCFHCEIRPRLVPKIGTATISPRPERQDVSNG
jgi:hypothetical protein